MGSEMGLAHILAAMGKTPVAANDSEIPRALRFLPGLDRVCRPWTPGRLEGDLVVTLDTPSLSRLGRVGDCLPQGVDVVRIDHHRADEPAVCLTWEDTRQSSVGEMIWQMAAGRGWPLPAEAATALFVAIITDTGRFTFPNTRPSALTAAAALLDAGADHQAACRALYQSESLGLMRLKGEGVLGLRFVFGGKVAVMRLSLDMFRRHQVNPIDTQEFADIPRSVEGVHVGVLLREMDEAGKVKVSLRSHDGLDLRPVAREFGGGGHPAAAGCETTGGLDRA
ncbi:MAG TPA: DHHA1 domain-containing protein, partial [Candidatus Brocadiia bacterium]|nr:DHHA1 domain-containing protein [Candidatus Brocadiia bacterium]